MKTSTKASVERIMIDVSIDCMDLLGEDLDILEAFGDLGDEVTYYTDVTVTKDMTDAFLNGTLEKEIETLKTEMEKIKNELLQKITD